MLPNSPKELRRLVIVGGQPKLAVEQCVEGQSSEPENRPVNTQWSSGDGTQFFPAGETRKELSPGVYSIGMDYNRGTYFRREAVHSDDLVFFEEAEADLVIREITAFWEAEEKYVQFGMLQKRGILLYGPPGSGKTCICRMVMDDVIKRNGIVVKLDQGVSVFISGLKVLREIQPETPVVVLIEDVDIILEDDEETALINVLDGVDSISKVIFLATTNYPEKLEERIANRPSRFDRRIRVSPPSENNRRLFIKRAFSNGVKHDEKMINKWVDDTKEMSVAHIKELIIAVHVLGDDYDESLKRLKEMKNSLRNTEGSAGFKQ